MSRLVPFVVACVLLTACSVEGGADTAGEGAPGALAFEAPLVGGGTFEGSDYEGRDVALWFWAPW